MDLYKNPVQEKSRILQVAPCPGPTKNLVHTMQKEASCQIMQKGTIQLDTIHLCVDKQLLYLVGLGMSVMKSNRFKKEPDL